MADTETLRGALEQAVEGLAYIGWKRMFGYDAVFRDGTIFALIWTQASHDTIL
jgi:TfoX/Sxy family transcriptional regulator of competence genes